ncbi:MAG: putative rane protein [Verrucomicrobiota bacterium]|jgi:membrane-associated phospholipid phosphatase
MKHYTFIDYATQGYIAMVAVIVCALHGDAVPGWGWFVAAHTACFVLVHLLIRASAKSPQNRVLDFLRNFYPVLLYTAFYRETGSLNQMVHTGYVDPTFFRLDEQIFGFAPSFKFMDAFPQTWVSEIFYFSYFSYYLMITGVGLALFLRERKQFYHYVSVCSFVFYVCYTIYIFLPVVGPRIYYRELVDFDLPPDVIPSVVPEFPASVQAGPFFKIMAVIYHNFESPGAAFPSSHVAIALVTVYFSFLYLRKIRWPHLVLALLLCASTVYGRYHYAIDVAAGALTTAIFLPLGNWLYRKFGKPSPDQTARS